MKFTILNEKEFDEFAIKQTCKNFYQTSYMYNHLIKTNHETYLVGMKNDRDEILCASLISVVDSTLGQKSFEALKGFLIEYNNTELLKEFVRKIKSFIKSKGGFRLIIEPYVPLIQRDIDGNVLEGGYDNHETEKYLYSLGFRDFEIGSHIKWLFALDINGKTADELYNDFKPNTRNYINRTITKYKLNVKTLTYDQLDQFKKITSDTCERRSFSDKSLAYYESMYNNFKDLVTFKVVELNCDTYINELKKEINEYERKINELSDSTSNKKKKENFIKELDNCKNKIDETIKLKEEKGNIIPLSGAMFVLYGDEVIYLFSGSYKEYMSFCGQYRLQWEIIKYAAENKYKRYNFFGIKDIFNKNGKDYGVYEFKKGFNGYVEEEMGPYEIGTNSFYKIFNFIKKIKNLFRKK